jgi:hypothetical protein
MKNIKLVVAAVIVMAAMSVSGQWTTSGDHIYYNNGSIGIGTDSPHSQYLVHASKNIAGPQIAIQNTGGAGGAAFSMIDDDSNTFWRFKSFAFDSPDGLNAGFKIRDHANLMDVITIENSSMVNAIFIKEGGFIGIGGIDNPRTSLDVNGTVACSNLLVDGKIETTEVEVKLDVWPDYVFEDNYVLSPLSEVEEFIKANKHLPGVPTQNEIIENGLSLGEINKVLMEKVEELTLYVIELQKQVDYLKQK